MTNAEMHAYAREYAEQLKAKGARFDKKHLRWNDIVAVGEWLQKELPDADHQPWKAGLREAVECCVIGHTMYIPEKGPLSLISELIMLGELERGPNI